MICNEELDEGSGEEEANCKAAGPVFNKQFQNMKNHS
jgi:hypothetical protein